MTKIKRADYMVEDMDLEQKQEIVEFSNDLFHALKYQKHMELRQGDFHVNRIPVDFKLPQLNEMHQEMDLDQKMLMSAFVNEALPQLQYRKLLEVEEDEEQFSVIPNLDMVAAKAPRQNGDAGLVALSAAVSDINAAVATMGKVIVDAQDTISLLAGTSFTGEATTAKNNITRATEDFTKSTKSAINNIKSAAKSFADTNLDATSVNPPTDGNLNPSPNPNVNPNHSTEASALNPNPTSIVNVNPNPTLNPTDSAEASAPLNPNPTPTVNVNPNPPPTHPATALATLKFKGLEGIAFKTCVLLSIMEVQPLESNPIALSNLKAEAMKMLKAKYGVELNVGDEACNMEDIRSTLRYVNVFGGPGSNCSSTIVVRNDFAFITSSG